MQGNHADNEIRLIRIYDATAKQVWSAWADPEQVALWWGPRGFTLTTHSKHLKTGGTWAYTMHGPDGTNYENKTQYLEVIEHSRLVYDHGGNDERPPLFRVTVNFTERGGRTTMDMTMSLPTAEAAAQTRKYVRAAGGETTWDRLAEHLARRHHGAEIYVINRSFEVDTQRMFEAWSNPKKLAQWLAPAGFEMEFIHADLTSGGSSFYCMKNAAGAKMHGRAE